MKKNTDNAPRVNHVVLQIFAKIPEKGKVKTRLAAQSSDDFALAVAKASLQCLCQKAIDIWPGKVELWLANIDTYPQSAFVQKLAADYPSITIKSQITGNLGDKMFSAMKDAKVHQQQAVIIGADIPHISAETLLRAYTLASNDRSFIGPCEDGGYYMVSSNNPAHAMFTNVDWGSEMSFEQTLSAWNNSLKQNSQAKPELLDMFFDIDFIEDVNKASLYDNTLALLIKQFEKAPAKGNF